VTVTAAIILIAIYHWQFTSWGLKAGFTYDDLMNLGRSIQFPIAQVLKELGWFFGSSDLYRPLGELWYRLIYEVFGPSPPAYRVAIQVLLAIDVLLASRFFYLVTRDLLTTLLATLAFSHLPTLAVFYFNTGMVFDLLCFAFYFGAANFYLKRRLAGMLLSYREGAVFWVLLILALNSKEMATTLPVVLLASELTIPGDWTWRRLLPLAVGSICVAAFVFGRVYGPNGIGKLGGGYHTEYTVTRFLHQGKVLLSEFFLQHPKGNGALLFLGFIAVTLVAILVKDRAPKIGLICAVVGVLPIVFLDRGLAAAYVALPGWILVCAWLVVQVFVKLLRTPAVIVFLALFGLLWTQSSNWRIPEDAALEEGRYIAGVMADVRSLNLKPPQGARILLITDPFALHSRWDTTFMFMILFKRSQFQVDRPPGAGLYHAVLTYEDGHVRRLSNP